MPNITKQDFRSLGGSSRRYEWVGSQPTYDTKGRFIAPGDSVSRAEYQKMIGKPLARDSAYKKWKPQKQFEQGKVWIFRYQTKSRGFDPEYWTRNNYRVNELVWSFPATWTVQIFVQGNRYGGVDTGTDPNEWPWVSTLEMAKHFRDNILKIVKDPVEFMVLENGIVPSGIRGDMHGVNEVHVIGWDVAKVKREMTPSELKHRKSNRRG